MSAFTAAAHILDAPTFGTRFEGLVDREQQRINWDPILSIESAQQYSTGELTLVNTALALWSGHDRDKSGVAAILSNLDDECIDRVIEAMLMKREA